MPYRESSSWLYPRPTGDLGRDRIARTVQFACLVLSAAVGALAIANLISHEARDTNVVFFCAVGALLLAAVVNRSGEGKWAARIAFLVVLLTATVLVFEARDGLRSHAMLVFPGLLLISVLLLDRASYVTTSGIVLLTVAALGICEINSVTWAVHGTLTRTSYASIFYVDLNLLVIALIGSRIARDWRESENQLVSIYNTVRDVIFHLVVEPEGQFRFTSVNAAFLRVTGLSREAVVGKTVNEVIPEPSLTMILGKYRQAIEEKTTVSWEETTDYPTGLWTGVVSIAPVFDKTGSCTHLVGSVHDITERTRAEAALRESEERFRKVFEEGPLGLAIIGRDYRFLKVNKALCQMVGYSEVELYQASFADIAHAEDVQTSMDLAERLFSGESPSYRLQKRSVKKNGETMWINLTGSVIHDPDGKPRHGFVMIEDITVQKRAEEAFQKSQKELQRSHEQIRHLAGCLINAQEEERRRIARELHDDLNQQLAAMSISMSVLRQQLPSSTEAISEWLCRAQGQVTEIIDHIRALSHGLHPATLPHVGLTAALESIIREFNSSHDIVARLTVSDGFPALADEVAIGIYRIAQECLNNVGRHSQARCAEMTLSVEKNVVTLCVSDDGRGFDTELAETTRGLGLISMAERASLLKGVFDLRTYPRAGTAIRVSIPIGL